MMQHSAVLRAPREIDIAAVLAPVPGPHEVRVRLEGCGVCASSLSVWEGRSWFRYPLQPGVPGHEGWGVVDQVGAEVKRIEVGERVALLSQAAFAQFDVAHEEHVVRIPEDFRHLPFPGEALGCTTNIFRRSEIGPQHSVAIVGAGFLGILLTQMAKSAGAQVTVLSRRSYGLQRARESGADAVVNIGPGAEERAIAMTAGRGFDRVIEVVGAQSTLDLASALTGEYGRLVIAGYHQDGLRHVNMQQWNWRGLEVINAHERSAARYVAGMQEAIDCIQKGTLDPFPLITHQLALQELNAGFRFMDERPDGFVKAVVALENTG